MPLIRAITGSESFAGGSGTMQLRLMPSKGIALPGNQPIFISDAAKKELHVTLAQRQVFLPAANNGISEHGSYWDGNFEVEEGAVLKLYARRRVRIANRPMVDDGAVFLRVRANAALQRLQFLRIDSQHSTNATVLVEGRFDIMSIRDAGAAKVPIEAADLALTRADRVRTVLTHTEIRPAISAPSKVRIQKVRDHEGNSVEVVSTRHRRPINI